MNPRSVLSNLLSVRFLCLTETQYYQSNITLSVYTGAKTKPALYPRTAAKHNGIERHNTASVKHSLETIKLHPIP